MLGFHHDDHSARLELAHQRVGDLRCQTLLHLRSFRVKVNQASDFREPRDAAVLAGDVSDMCDAVERHQVMFTRRVHRYRLHQHQLVMLLVEGGVQHGIRIGVEPGENLLVRTRDAGRCIRQAMPIRVFTHRIEQFTDRGLGTCLVEDVTGRMAVVLGRLGRVHISPCSRCPRPEPGPAADAEWAPGTGRAAADMADSPAAGAEPARGEASQVRASRREPHS
ncbi:Uncharacterised protein [Mycobacteroides abscessus subsp. abscessus]|nr:Uncharacterised protein [Mycobacteroides abscessus subsp. abscessus]